MSRLIIENRTDMPDADALEGVMVLGLWVPAEESRPLQ